MMPKIEVIAPLVFPDLILLADYGGDFQNYFKAVYKTFENDFVKNRPDFMGIVVSAQKHPEVDGMHRTFYHITHEGESESERLPDVRRMERIRFPKFCIENAPHEDLKVWKNVRNRDTRVCIYSVTQNYLVVLTERSGYNLFWTAYVVDHPHQQKRLMREWEAYIKAKTA